MPAERKIAYMDTKYPNVWVLVQYPDRDQVTPIICCSSLYHPYQIGDVLIGDDDRWYKVGFKNHGKIIEKGSRGPRMCPVYHLVKLPKDFCPKKYAISLGAIE